MKAAAGMRGLMRRAVTDPRPYPEPFSAAERAVIEHAIVSGIEIVKRDPHLDLKTCDEIDINVALEHVLNHMLHNPPADNRGFCRAIFETIVRGPELVDHNHVMPEKRPDLVFRSSRALPRLAFPAQCALLVECKIVDKQRPMSFYCGKGLVRFVDGTYAWAVPSAYMLGYTRGKGYQPMRQLHEHLQAYGSRYELVGQLTPRPGSGPVQLYLSVHGRSQVKQMPRGSRGQITVNHLWVAIA